LQELATLWGRRRPAGERKKITGRSIMLIPSATVRDMTEPKLPLRGLTVFEAAARLSSFRAAAAELNLTASAVSHQIAQLEDSLGVELFERTSRGVTLSPEGASYARSIRPLLAQLQQATDDMAHSHGRGNGRKGAREIVRIRTPPSLASRWIVPRLAKFLADHPAIDIRVNAPYSSQQGEEADVTVTYGSADRWQSTAEPFLSEAIQPLCAPSLLVSGRIRRPDDLLGQTLISTKLNTLSWEDWFQKQGVTLDRRLLNPIQFDPSHLAIDAAISGLGFILESDVLTRTEIAAGTLAAPFPESAVSTPAYWLPPMKRSGTRSAVRIVYDWLVAEASS
jgi:LysR family transcriptional regulator, glycine cleavage system transcriptional activator